MRHLIALSLLLSATAAAHVAVRAAQGQGLGTTSRHDIDIPATIMGYQQEGADLPVEESVSRLLETNRILMRQYRSPNGYPVQLAVVEADRTRRSLHFPEVCFVAQGFEVREQYKAPVGVQFVGTRLVLTRGEFHEAVIYWFKTGNHFTGSYLENSARWGWEQLKFNTPTSSLIRVSTPITNQGTEAAFRLLDDFATSLTPYLLDPPE